MAYQVLRRSLALLGMVDADHEWDRSGPRTRLRLCSAIKRPSNTFKFARPLSPMQPLTEGEVIGRDESVSLVAGKDCYVAWVDEEAPVGEDMLSLALRE